MSFSRHDQLPATDRKVTLGHKLDILLARYGAGGDYDDLTGEPAGVVDAAVEELIQLKKELPTMLEAQRLAEAHFRILALERKVANITGRPRQAVPPLEPVVPVDPAVQAERDQAARDQLFAEAETLYSGLPDAKSFQRTSQVNTRIRLLLSEIDTQRRLVIGLARQSAPLSQLGRRVEKLREERNLVNVYANLVAMMHAVEEKRKLLRPNDPQRKIAEALLQLPNVDELDPVVELETMRRHYDALRELNIELALPEHHRDDRYALTGSDIIQDKPVTLHSVPQAGEVRGLRAVGGDMAAEEAKVQPITKVRRLVPIVYGHMLQLPNGPLRRQTRGVIASARILLERIDAAPNPALTITNEAARLRELQRLLASLDTQLLEVIAQDQEDAPTTPASAAEKVDVDVIEPPVATNIVPTEAWHGSMDDGTTVELPDAAIAPLEGAPTPVVATATATTVEPAAAVEAARPVLRTAEPRAAVSPDQERAMYRSKYRNLLRQRAELEKKVTTTGIVAALTRSSHKKDLERLNAVMARFRTDHPEVATVTLQDLVEPVSRAEEASYLHTVIDRRTEPQVRRAVGGKLLALEKAEVKQVMEIAEQRAAPTQAQRANERLRLAEARRRKPSPKIERRQLLVEINRLLKHPPGVFQAQTTWFDSCQKWERELYAQSYQNDAAAAALYWEQKLTVLEEIKPSFFGRDRWQQEYDRAQTQLRQAKTLAIEQRTDRLAA